MQDRCHGGPTGCVGPDVLIWADERSSSEEFYSGLVSRPACGASLRRAGEDTCPYAIKIAKTQGRQFTWHPEVFSSAIGELLAVQRAGGAELAPGYGTGWASHGKRSRGHALALQQHRNHGVLGFLHEHERALRTHVNADEVPQLDLSGSDQIGQLEDDMPLDGALEVPCAIFRISPLVQQEAFHLGRATEDELVHRRRHQNALLYHAQLDFQNLLEMFRAQRPEDYGLVDAVHELRTEFAPGRIHSSAADLVVESRVHLQRLSRKAQAA